MDAILQSWPVLVSLLCGLLLAAVILALIFKQDFRKDVTAKQGKASLFNAVSVEGVIVVLLSGMLLAGLLYPVWRNPEITSLRTRIGELEKEIGTLKSKDSDQPGPIENLSEAVASLEPDSDLSSQIRGLARDQRGPWSRYSQSQDILISIPGGLVTGKALGCPELYEKDLQLISTYSPNGQALNGEPLAVYVGGLIFAANDCRDNLQYDLKLNCTAAATLFSREVIECDDQNNPKWKVADRLLPASAVVFQTFEAGRSQ